MSEDLFERQARESANRFFGEKESTLAELHIIDCKYADDDEDKQFALDYFIETQRKINQRIANEFTSQKWLTYAQDGKMYYTNTNTNEPEPESTDNKEQQALAHVDE